MAHRKNVFVIGAGASAHRQAPLMGNFLAVAREILDTSPSLGAKEQKRFRTVIDYRNVHDLTEKVADIKLSNLEDLFGLVDLNARVDPDILSLRRDLVFLILKTLEQSIVPERPITCPVFYGTGQASGSLVRQATVMRQFVDIVARRWEDPH
jgi:hypothetical protein